MKNASLPWPRWFVLPLPACRTQNIHYQRCGRESLGSESVDNSEVLMLNDLLPLPFLFGDFVRPLFWG